METRGTPLNPIKDLHSRFLYPFFFRRHSVHEAATALLGASLPGRDGRRLTVWECPGPHDLYREEVLDHVVEFLFPGTETAGCQYLKLSGAVGNRWFGDLEARLPADMRLPIRLVPAASIELFLSSYGVGLLSIALAAEQHELSVSTAIELNHRLSQLRWSSVGDLHLSHPADDPQRWARLSPEARQNIPPVPAPDAPLEERLGRPGGTFTPGELVEELLRPLTTFALQQVQERLSVYTVVRFGAEVDFEHPEVRATYAPLLSGLAQVEESTHAGAPTDTVGVTHTLLNRRHWAGVGLLGAAHLVADQEPPDHPFNTARVPRVFLRYFIPYLAAVLQCHTLHRIVDDAAELVLAPYQDTAARLAALRRHLLEFAVGGHFTQISSREALHRYYRLCQEGLDVAHAMAAARQALSDLDAQYTTARQVRVAEDMAQNVAATREVQEGMQCLQHSMTAHLRTVAQVQVLVEYIEIFLVSVYAAHLWHMIEPQRLIEEVSVPKWLHDILTILPHGAWVFVIAMLAGGITALCLRPWRHRRSRTEDHTT
jgi:hypothetical protein